MISEEKGQCIYRQEAIDAFQIFREYESNRSSGEWVDRIETVLNQLPPVNSQPKTGYWILTSDDDYEYCTCSECGYQNGENWMIGSQIKYCQECGAKMVKPQEREE